MRSISGRIAIVALVVLASVGCKGKKKPNEAQAGPGSTPPGNAQDAAVPSGDNGTVGEGLGLFERLEAEKQARPAGTPNADTILAALESAGVKVKTRKQFLGSTVLAIYCTGGQTAAGVAIAVCEYASAEAAARGREHTIARFPIEGREIWINGRTTLAVSRATPSSENEREITLAKETFSKL